MAASRNYQRVAFEMMSQTAGSPRHHKRAREQAQAPQPQEPAPPASASSSSSANFSGKGPEAAAASFGAPLARGPHAVKSFEDVDEVEAVVAASGDLRAVGLPKDVERLVAGEAVKAHGRIGKLVEDDHGSVPYFVVFDDGLSPHQYWFEKHEVVKHEDEVSEDELSQDPVNIVVTTLGGNMYDLMVCGTDTVRSVKNKMEAIVGSPADGQRLFLGKLELRDGRTLSSFSSFRDGSTFSVVYGSKHLVLKIQSNERTVRLEALETSTIAEVKAAAMKELQMADRMHAMGAMCLIFACKPCDDDKTLLDYLVGNEALLQLAYVRHAPRRF